MVFCDFGLKNTMSHKIRYNIFRKFKKEAKSIDMLKKLW